MPIRQENITTAANRVLSTGTIDIDGTQLKGISLTVRTGNYSPVSAFAEIGIMAGGTAQGNIVAILASGYIGSNASLTWFQSFKGSPEQHAFCNIRSDAAMDFKLSVISE